jgi:hypothetical protein
LILSVVLRNISTTKGGLPNMFLGDNYFMTGQRTMIVDILLSGNQALTGIPCGSDLEIPPQQKVPSKQTFSNRLDKGGKLQYEGLINEIFRDNTSDALLFTSLFIANPKERTRLFGKYVAQHYSPKNPMFPLLMCLTEQVSIKSSHAFRATQC